MVAMGLNIRSFTKSLFILALLFCASITLNASADAQLTKSARIVLKDDQTRFYIGDQLYITQDDDKSLSPNVIFNRYQSNLRGIRSTNKLINLGLTNSHSIMAFSLTNNSLTEDWYLNFGRLIDGRQSTVKNVKITNILTNETTNIEPIDYKNSIGPAVAVSVKRNNTQFFVVSYEQEGGFANTVKPYFISKENHHNKGQN